MKRDTLSIRATALSITASALAASLLVPEQASAQIGFYAVPSVSVARVRDDNLFFAAENEIEDELTRLTPALEIGYDSTRFSVRANYTMDAERYKDNDQLDSNNTRSLADLEIEYLPNPRLTLGAGASFVETETPVDLAVLSASGFPAGRVDAERVTINPYVEYGFSAATTGRLEFTQSSDEIDGGTSSDTSEVEARFEHGLSAQNLLTAGYRFRHYEFDDFNEEIGEFDDRDSSDSHTPWIGWTHRFTPSTRFVSEIGPRIGEGNGDDDEELYLLLSLRHQYERGQAEISYTIDENTSIGDIGRIENRTISANVTHAFNDNFSFSLIGNAGEVIYYDLTSDIRQLGVDFRYRILESFALFAGYTHNFQNAGFLEDVGREISRDTFILGLTLAYPSRRPLPDEPN